MLNTIAFEGPFGDGNFALAVRASQLGRVGVEMRADPFVTGRAGVGDVHEIVFVGS